MVNSVNILTERIDDIVLLLHVMRQIGLPDLLNRHLPRHWKQSGLDWGWVAVIWRGLHYLGRRPPQSTIAGVGGATTLHLATGV